MRSLTLPRRLATGALLLGTAAALAACTGNAVPGSAGTASPAPAGPGNTVGPAGSPSGAPCTLLTSDDVKNTLGEGVTKTTGSTSSASDGSSIGQCVLSTDGPALMGGNAQAVLAFVAGLTGRQPDFTLDTGGIAVIVANSATPVTAAATGAPLPSGGIAPSDIGKSAYALPLPTGGGIATCQVDDNTQVVIADLEGKQVTADQLTALLRAAVGRA